MLGKKPTQRCLCGRADCGENPLSANPLDQSFLARPPVFNDSGIDNWPNALRAKGLAN